MDLFAEFELVDTEQKWMKRAACKGMPTEVFFPEAGYNKHKKLAEETCRVCPVRLRCLDFALNNKISHGIWGGMAGGSRKKYRRWLSE